MTNTVLIADSNPDRCRAIGEACAHRGLAVATVDSGAVALERTLADVPELVVAAGDLALIAARRLAEILRANPRTQHVRIVFVGRDTTGGLSSGLFDEVLPPETHERDVASRVEAMLAQRARIDAVGRETSTDHEVQGQLSQIPLTDLLQVFHMNRRTGELQLSRTEPGRRREQGRVLLRDGNVVQAHAGPLVEGEKALYRLLSWRDGSFAFAPTRVTAAARILTPTRALLLEGVRQLDEWERLRGNLPPLGAKVVLSVAKVELPNAVHPVTQEVLLLLEIYDRVREIVDHCGYPDYQVLRTLQTLIDRGLVELQREPENASSDRGTLFDALQVRQLREWLEKGRARRSGSMAAKVLVASADPGATRDFTRLLESLPGMEAAPAVRDGGPNPGDLVELGHLAVGEGLGIDWIHLPAADSFRATWPVACHGALGTLVLVSMPVGDTEAALRPLLEQLSRQPDSRIFYVILLRKGERVQPEHLQEKLSLLSSSSLFLLQVESGRDPVSLLKTMLARVLP